MVIWQAVKMAPGMGPFSMGFVQHLAVNLADLREKLDGDVLCKAKLPKTDLDARGLSMASGFTIFAHILPNPPETNRDNS